MQNIKITSMMYDHLICLKITKLFDIKFEIVNQYRLSIIFYNEHHYFLFAYLLIFLVKVL